jgi:hypothetical protein
MNVRSLLGVLATAAVVLWGVAGSQAADMAPPIQLPGEHSSITTSDGSIRDDELAKFIKDKLDALAADKKPKDVKILVQSCFGGGILDDLGGALDMLGIPWVGGAASAPEEPSWGPGNPTTKGDYWTDELVKAIKAGTAGDTVKTDITTAKDNDPARPGGAINTKFPQAKENPVVASGSGGDGIKWNGAAKHEVVLFAGKPDGQRHTNDLNNMKTALGDLLDGENIKCSQTEGKTTQNLKDMIMGAINNLDNTTQLVLYFSDHGDTHFDIDEFLNSITIPVSPFNGFETDFPLHDGWKTGFDEALLLPSPVDPYLTLELDGSSPSMLLDDWQLYFQGDLIPLLPGGVLAPGGLLDIPLPPSLFGFGNHSLSLVPLVPSTGSDILFSNLELSNGGITTLTVPIPEPASLCLLLVGLACCQPRRR